MTETNCGGCKKVFFIRFLDKNESRDVL